MPPPSLLLANSVLIWSAEWAISCHWHIRRVMSETSKAAVTVYPHSVRLGATGLTHIANKLKCTYFQNLPGTRWDSRQPRLCVAWAWEVRCVSALIKYSREGRMLLTFWEEPSEIDGGGRELIAVAEDVRTLSLSAGLRFWVAAR